MKNLKLKSARAAKDLSQDDLAKICNVSRQTISAIEKGDYNPNHDHPSNGWFARPYKGQLPASA